MAGVLNFSQYLGGPDSINIEQIFPSTQRTLNYNFATNITGWTFALEQQTIIVDTVAFDRNTGQPNFSGSVVLGYYADVQPSSNTYVSVTNASAGLVNVTVPTNMYTGPILPDARKNVPITIFSVKWTDTSSPAQVNLHRWAFIQCWGPGVTPGDPVLSVNYTAIA
jgi:hypothetical protein